MIFFSTLRVMPYSVIIKRSSSCCTYEQIKRPTARQYTQSDFESCNPKRDVGIKSLHSEVMETHRGGRKSIGARGNGGHQENNAL